MVSKSCLSIIFLISAVYGCAETDCDEFTSQRDWKHWSPDTINGQQMAIPLRDTRPDGSFGKIFKRVKSKRVQDHLSSDLGFESIRNNAELPRTLLQRIIQNVQRSQDFPQRSNRADSKENYHLQASYIPRLG